MFIIFIDVDNMKGINDTFGHRKGDQALLDTASVIQKTFREADIIARMGGDEFAVIAIETSEITDDILFSRLHENIDIHNRLEKRKFNLSMSIGIVYFDHQCNYSVDELLSKADTLMYEHKKSKLTYIRQPLI